jgi:hypothetical protein
MYMSFVPAVVPFDPYVEEWRSRGIPRLAKQLCDVGHFLGDLGVQMRFGELTHAPLRLLRFQIIGGSVECDWLARLPNPAAADLTVRDRYIAHQALKDAIDVRSLLFSTLPQADSAELRAFRESANHTHELIIKGSTQRNDNTARGVHSLTVRAKILGFRFRLEADTLQSIALD